MGVEVLRAKDLKGGSFFDKLDPYCKVQVSGTDVELKTPVLNNAGNNPVWNFSGEVTYISLDEEGLKFTVLDKDVMSDDLCGIGALSMEEIAEGFDGVVVLEEEEEMEPQSLLNHRRLRAKSPNKRHSIVESLCSLFR